MTQHLEAPETEFAARVAATKLRNALRLNTEFSLVTGLVGLIFAGPIADLLGIDQVWLVRAVGASLLAFAAFVFFIAGTRTATLKTWSAEISLADLGWVAGTVVVIAAGWVSRNGAIALAIVGLVVLDLAIMQMRARRRLVGALVNTTAPLDESPAIEVVTYERSADGSSSALWPVISDHDLYARLALNLKGAANVTPNGEGFQRTCTDSAGRTWSETCTLWDPGHRFDVDIDEYPYPLQVMQGSWAVQDAAQGASTVSMRFAFQPNGSLFGRLFTPTMHLLFPPILRRIAKGWERVARERSTVATA